MFKELPNYVFHKSYDHFYLLTEFDIIFNREFTRKIDLLMQKIHSANLFVELDVPNEYKSLIPKHIEITRNNLDNFYDMALDYDGNKTFYYMMNFFIRDDSMEWEIYVSLENEISILACSSDINSIFKTITNPYENENIEKKYKIVGDSFNNNNMKLKFLNALEKNYCFRSSQ